MTTRRQRKIPIYQKVSENLRLTIEQGSFGEGEPLPTEAKLREQYGVSRHTVRQAFQELVADGLVYRVPGQGTFATHFGRRDKYLRSIGSIEEVMSWPATEMEVLRNFESVADAEAEACLELGEGEVGLLVVRRKYNGVPFVITHVYLPRWLGDRLQEKLSTETPGTIIGSVTEVTTYPVSGATQDITSVAAPQELAPFIDCEPGEPILHTERIYHDARDTPLEYAISHYNPRRYSYHLKLRSRLS